MAKDSAETGVEISLWHMNSHSSPGAHFDTKKFYEKLLILDVDENLLDEERDERLAGRMIGAGFDTFDDMITQVGGRCCLLCPVCLSVSVLSRDHPPMWHITRCRLVARR